MKLDSLTIFSGGDEVRSINFRDGLNLIVDDTEQAERRVSGNNVGKTTFLRAVRYCLGSNSQEMFRDPEFGSQDTELKNYLVDHNYSLFLKLYDENSGKSYTLKRDFASGQTQTKEINGEACSSQDEYREVVSEILFPGKPKKPTLNQLLAKFIRSDSYKMGNALKFLHQATPLSEYENLHFFLFGFPDTKVFQEKLFIEQSKKYYQNQLDALTKEHGNVSTQRQRLEVISEEIAEKERQLKEFEISQSYEEELALLDDVKRKVADLSNEVSDLQFRIDLQNKTLKELEDAQSGVEYGHISQLYEEAMGLIGNLQTTFEELSEFNKNLLNSKISFVKKSIPNVKKKLDKKRSELNEALKAEEDILSRFSEKSTISDLYIIKDNISQLYEKKGGVASLISTLERADDNLKNVENSLSEISQRIKDVWEVFENKRLTPFNKFFSKYTDILYGEKYIVTHEENDDGVFKFYIKGLHGNIGGGKKKSLVGAFDLAHQSFVIEAGLKQPLFVLHDSNEDVDDNQLSTLFDLAESVTTGQYFLSILSGRLRHLNKDWVEEREVLSLKEADKFFRI